MQTINIGSAPNDGTGDSLRNAFDKANQNFSALTKAEINYQTASYTVQSSDSGKILEVDSATGVNVNLPPDAPAGTTLTVCQCGAGIITFVPQTNAQLKSRDGAIKTAGQWALATIYVRSNSDNLHAIWVLGGDITT